MTKLNHNLLKWKRKAQNEARQLRESNLMPAKWKSGQPSQVGYDMALDDTGTYLDVLVYN